MKQELQIFGRQYVITEKDLKQVFFTVMDNVDHPNPSVNLAFVSGKAIRELNEKYRGKDDITDVLSFKHDEDGILGEIVISPLKIKKQAKEFDTTERDEMIKMFVHGLLHLLDYDHIEDSDKIIMEKKEEELLSKIKF